MQDKIKDIKHQNQIRVNNEWDENSNSPPLPFLAWCFKDCVSSSHETLLPCTMSSYLQEDQTAHARN
jgi:hypothetical protein